MTALDGIRKRAAAYDEHGTPGLHAPQDRARLLRAVEAVEKLAEYWETQGERDMAFSKTVPDENIAVHFLGEGASMVENARLIRAALAEALGD